MSRRRRHRRRDDPSRPSSSTAARPSRRSSSRRCKGEPAPRDQTVGRLVVVDLLRASSTAGCGAISTVASDGGRRGARRAPPTPARRDDPAGDQLLVTESRRGARGPAFRGRVEARARIALANVVMIAASGGGPPAAVGKACGPVHARASTAARPRRRRAAPVGRRRPRDERGPRLPSSIESGRPPRRGPHARRRCPRSFSAVRRHGDRLERVERSAVRQQREVAYRASSAASRPIARRHPRTRSRTRDSDDRRRRGRRRYAQRSRAEEGARHVASPGTRRERLPVQLMPRLLEPRPRYYDHVEQSPGQGAC